MTSESFTFARNESNYDNSAFVRDFEKAVNKLN